MEDQERQELIDAIEALSKLKPSDYVRTDELGLKMDFQDALSRLEDIRSLFLKLAESDLRLAADRQANHLLSATRNLKHTITQISEFDVTAPDAVGQRDNLLTEVSRLYLDALQASGPIIALSFAWSGGGDLAEMRREARERNAEMNAMMEKASAQLAARMAQADSVVDTLRDRAAEGGVVEYAVLFETAANDFAVDKDNWLKRAREVAIGGGALALINVAAVVVAIYKNWLDDPGAAIQVAVAKLVLFSFVYYVLVWLVRMYRAAAHNEVVNRHRCRAMRSFEKFVAATKDEQTKQAVLLRATESIFVHQSSGLTPEPRRETGASQWLEIVRGVSPSAGDSN